MSPKDWMPMEQIPPAREDLLLWVDDAMPIVGWREGNRFYAATESGFRGESPVKPSHWMLIERPEDKSPEGECKHESVNVGRHPEEGDIVICKDCGKELN